MRILILSFLYLFLSHVYGQGYAPAGSRSMSMANASVAFNDVWAYHNNPGAVADVDHFSVALSYENRFLLKEMQNQAFAVAIPLKIGVVSIGGHFYGYSQYRSVKAGAGYSLKLSEKLYAGVQLNYQGLQLSNNYGAKNTLTAEAGIYAKITEKWKMGISVFNLGRAKLSDFQDDRFSTTLRLGSAYHFSDKLIVSGEFDKDLDNDLRFKVGVDYQLVNQFFIRGGFATSPTELTFGFGYHFKQVHLNFGSAYSNVLGWSPQFSLLFRSKSK